MFRKKIKNYVSKLLTRLTTYCKDDIIRIVENAPVMEKQPTPNMDLTVPQSTQLETQTHETNAPHDIYYLRNAKLDEKLMYQLAPFINANRPQTPVTKWQELRQQFGPPKDRIAPMSFKEIVKQSEEMNSKFVIGSKWWK